MKNKIIDEKLEKTLKKLQEEEDFYQEKMWEYLQDTPEKECLFQEYEYARD